MTIALLALALAVGGGGGAHYTLLQTPLGLNAVGGSIFCNSPCDCWQRFLKGLDRVL